MFPAGDDNNLALQAAVVELAPAGVLTAARFIVDEDEFHLTSAESKSLEPRPPAGRRQSGAARALARDLLAAFGHNHVELPRSPSGAPAWPIGVVGSLAHDREAAVAVVGSGATFLGLGVDIEPSRPLPAGLARKIMAPREAQPTDLVHLRQVFSIKEAVYKATHPLDGRFLGFQDVEIDLVANLARTTTGHLLSIASRREPRILSLAWIAK